MDKTNKTLISISIALMVIIIFLIILSLNRKPSLYTITFDTDGGSEVLDQSVKKNSKMLKPADPTKKGYIFVEWQYKNKPFDFNTKIIENITLTAIWQEVKENVEMITIEFDSAGGSLVSKQIIEKGTKVTKPEDPTRKDYKFIDWVVDDEPFDFESEVQEDTIIKAKWEKNPEKQSEKKPSSESSKPKDDENNNDDNNNENNDKEYTVTFNSTGGSEVANQTVSENNKVTIPESPTKTGYKFYDWLLNGNSYNFDNPVTDNLTLVASWSPIKYVISYNINTDSGTGNMETTTCEYDKECNLNNNNYSRENYSFIGWATSSTGQVAYSNNSSVLNLSSKNNDVITLYAVWQSNE